jgi:hypothetical protein
MRRRYRSYSPIRPSFGIRSGRHHVRSPSTTALPFTVISDLRFARARSISYEANRSSFLICEPFLPNPISLLIGSCDVLQHKYPEATLHRSKMQPLPPLRSGPDQIIWVTSVNPEPDLSHRVFSNGVNENVQLYHRYNNIKTFSTLRPYKVLSASTRSEDESAGVMTWLEKTTLTCKSKSSLNHVKADYRRQGHVSLCSCKK